MKPTEEHVLEFALSQTLGRDNSDLTRRILAGCRSGQRRREPEPPRRRRSRHLIAVAAIVLVAASSYLAMAMLGENPTGNGASGPAHARSEAPLLANRGANWSPRPRQEFRAGDVIMVRDPARLELPRNTTAAARPGTILRLMSSDQLELSVGAAVFSTDTAPLVIATPAGTIRLAPQSSIDLTGQAPEYALDPDLTLPELARRIHMLDTTLAISLAITLLHGSGELVVDDTTKQLQPGVSLRQQAKTDAAGLEQFRRQIGTWDLVVTAGDRTLRGVEKCRAGSGGHSLVIDTEVRVGDRRIQTTELLSYDPKRRRYSGLYADSFGGELGLLLGNRSEDLKERTLQMNKFHGGEFGIRIRMRWESADERHTWMELRRNGKWQLRRKVVHKRRPAASELVRVTLGVRDLTKQTAFYRDLLGLRVVAQSDTAVELATGASVLELQGGGQKAPGRTRPSFRVKDLRAVAKKLAAAGIEPGELRTVRSGVQILDARDPEGNPFRLEAHEGR